MPQLVKIISEKRRRGWRCLVKIPIKCQKKQFFSMATRLAIHSTCDGLALRDGDEIHSRWLSVTVTVMATATRFTLDGDEIHSQRRRCLVMTMLRDDGFTPNGSFQNRKYLRSDTIHVSLVCIIAIPAIHCACDT
jgi:hypothetical protein